MSQDYKAGDFLVFQIESGFGLMRVLDVERRDGQTVWHLAAYGDLFLDVDMAEAAIAAGSLTVEIPHAAMTDRAFESTQTAFITNMPVTESEKRLIDGWSSNSGNVPTDRSVRLLLGLR